MAKLNSKGRLRKRHPNGNKGPKLARKMRNMMLARGRALNPLRWTGLVPKSVALTDWRKP